MMLLAKLSWNPLLLQAVERLIPALQVLICKEPLCMPKVGIFGVFAH